VARLTGSSRAPVGWSVTSGRSQRSHRCAGRRRRWLELLWPRAQATEVVGGTCSGQTTAVGFNQSARGAPLGDVEAMRARNREMVQWVTRTTCSAGLRTLASVIALFQWGWSSAQAWESFTASRGSYPRARIEQRWAGVVWPWWAPSGGSNGSRGGRRSCGLARES
jgi:hypothetical protein